jgi:large subunit ribosomal protein L3
MKNGTVREKVVTVRPGDSLEEKAERKEYGGFQVDEINPGAGFVRFANDVEIKIGQSQGVDREALFEAQIRYTVEEHFRKQVRLKDAGIKVLSLFFIDRVDNYAREDGIIRRQFDQAFDEVKESKLKKPESGLFKKKGISPRRFIKEVFRDPAREYKLGEELKVDMFKAGDYVDVTGTSIGKGFAGGMKRWGWHGGPQTHGSMSHRRVGSIGSSAWPSRVWKGHHMPGHMGAATVTTQNLKVVNIIPEENLMLLKGSVPGCNNGYLVIRKAKKKK